MLILAAAMVPVVVAKCKPLAKQVGKGMVTLGEKLQEFAEEVAEEVKTASHAAAEPPKAAAAPKAKVATPKPKAAAKPKPKPRARKPKPAAGTA